MINDIYYLITITPNSTNFSKFIATLKEDICNKNKIKQCFFYSDASEIASTKVTEEQIAELIDLANRYQFDLAICSAAFKARNYVLRDFAESDFAFMGLGKFVVQSADAQAIRTF